MLGFPLQVLTDIFIRELQDLPTRDNLRICWLHLAKAILNQSQWSDAAGCNRYRVADISSTLSGLFDVSAALASGIPPHIRQVAQSVLIACSDALASE